MLEIEDLLIQLGATFATMHVRIWRSPGGRGTVFCVHGFDGNGTDFDFLAGRLIKDGFTVVCPDIIGHGRSTYLGEVSKYHFGVYVRCLTELSRFASARDNHFVGTSWGGAVLIAMLSGSPIKIGTLVLNDVGLRSGPAADDLTRRLRQESLLTFARIEDAQAYVRRTRAFLGNLPEALWSVYVSNRIREEKGRYRLAYDPFAVPAGQQEYDLVPMFDRIGADLFLMYGAESPFLDYEAISSIRARRSRVSFVAVQGAGHPLSLMTPSQSEMISSFLAGIG